MDYGLIWDKNTQVKYIPEGAFIFTINYLGEVAIGEPGLEHKDLMSPENYGKYLGGICSNTDIITAFPHAFGINPEPTTKEQLNSLFNIIDFVQSPKINLEFEFGSFIGSYEEAINWINSKVSSFKDPIDGLEWDSREEYLESIEAPPIGEYPVDDEGYPYSIGVISSSESLFTHGTHENLITFIKYEDDPTLCFCYVKEQTEDGSYLIDLYPENSSDEPPEELKQKLLSLGITHIRWYNPQGELIPFNFKQASVYSDRRGVRDWNDLHSEPIPDIVNKFVIIDDNAYFWDALTWEPDIHHMHVFDFLEFDLNDENERQFDYHDRIIAGILNLTDKRSLGCDPYDISYVDMKHMNDEVPEWFISLISSYIQKQASILSPVKEKLDPLVWNGDKLRPEVSEFCFSVVESLLENYMSEEEIPVHLRRAVLIGSITGYQYDDDADLDVNILIDLDTLSENLGIDKELLIYEIRGQVGKINGEIYPGTSHPCNLFLSTEEDYPPADGIYDMFTDEWIKKPGHPGKIDPYSNLKDAIDRAEQIAEKIDAKWGAATRTKVEIDRYPDSSPQIIRQYLRYLKSLKRILDNVVNERRESFDLAKKQELDPPQTGVPNVVYKYLEYNGLLEILHEAARTLKRYDQTGSFEILSEVPESLTEPSVEESGDKVLITIGQSLREAYSGSQEKISYEILSPVDDLSDKPIGPRYDKFVVFGNKFYFWNYEGFDLGYSPDDPDFLPSHSETANMIIYYGAETEDNYYASGLVKHDEKIIEVYIDHDPSEEELALFQNKFLGYQIEYNPDYGKSYIVSKKLAYSSSLHPNPEPGDDKCIIDFSNKKGYFFSGADYEHDEVLRMISRQSNSKGYGWNPDAGEDIGAGYVTVFASGRLSVPLYGDKEELSSEDVQFILLLVGDAFISWNDKDIYTPTKTSDYDDLDEDELWEEDIPLNTSFLIAEDGDYGFGEFHDEISRDMGLEKELPWEQAGDVIRRLPTAVRGVVVDNDVFLISLTEMSEAQIKSAFDILKDFASEYNINDVDVECGRTKFSGTIHEALGFLSQNSKVATFQEGDRVTADNRFFGTVKLVDLEDDEYPYLIEWDDGESNWEADENIEHTDKEFVEQEEEEDWLRHEVKDWGLTNKFIVTKDGEFYIWTSEESNDKHHDDVILERLNSNYDSVLNLGFYKQVPGEGATEPVVTIYEEINTGFPDERDNYLDFITSPFGDVEVYDYINEIVYKRSRYGEWLVENNEKIAATQLKIVDEDADMYLDYLDDNTSSEEDITYKDLPEDFFTDVPRPAHLNKFVSVGDQIWWWLEEIDYDVHHYMVLKALEDQNIIIEEPEPGEVYLGYINDGPDEDYSYFGEIWSRDLTDPDDHTVPEIVIESMNKVDLEMNDTEIVEFMNQQRLSSFDNEEEPIDPSILSSIPKANTYNKYVIDNEGNKYFWIPLKDRKVYSDGLPAHHEVFNYLFEQNKEPIAWGLVKPDGVCELFVEDSKLLESSAEQLRQIGLQVPSELMFDTEFEEDEVTQEESNENIVYLSEPIMMSEEDYDARYGLGSYKKKFGSQND